jgi:hypothetical protein
LYSRSTFNSYFETPGHADLPYAILYFSAVIFTLNKNRVPFILFIFFSLIGILALFIKKAERNQELKFVRVRFVSGLVVSVKFLKILTKNKLDIGSHHHPITLFSCNVFHHPFPTLLEQLVQPFQVK